MRVLPWIKLAALLLVLGVVGFTGALAWHVTVRPLGPLFEKLIPVSAGAGRAGAEVREVADALGPADVPRVDPGEPAFRKARDLLAMGDATAARKRFAALINSYPASSAAPSARSLLGEMNLDDLLGGGMTGKVMHPVKRGDSYLGIAAQQQSTLENMIHLNGMMDLRGLKPGDRLVVMPLHFRFLVEAGKGVLSVWDGGRFVCEFAIRSVPVQVSRFKGVTTIVSKSADADGKRVQPGAPGYASAAKSLLLQQPPLRIRAAQGATGESADSLLLDSLSMEELSLLARPGNQIEFR